MQTKDLFYILGCECPTGYIENNIGLCQQILTQAATVTQSNYCLAASQRGEYSNSKTRIYKPGFSNTSIPLTSAPSSDVYVELSLTSQWRNYTTAIFNAATAVDPATNIINLPGHGFVANVKVQYNSNGGTAPGNLTSSTYYYINIVDVNNVTLSLSPGGSVVDITSVGTGGTHKLLPIAGPMNRAGVWIDPNCDGVIDGSDTLPASGTKITLSYQYNNLGLARTIYVGIGADNQFQLTVNNTDIASTITGGDVNNFVIWHVFPVNIVQGINFFNIIGTGDGSVNDSIAMIIYDNTKEQLEVATNDSQLNILFNSSSLIGNHIDVATCSPGYNLDTSGGQGNYICKQVNYTSCQ